jgi:hypothetical protein
LNENLNPVKNIF